MAGKASLVRGHFAYYAVPDDIWAVNAFRTQVTRHWFKALRRRSQRHPPELGTHGAPGHALAPACPSPAPLPGGTLCRQELRQQPSAGIPHAGICAGAARKGGHYHNRSLLPPRVALPGMAHQRPPRPMGHEEVQATPATLRQSIRLAGASTPPPASPIRSLAARPTLDIRPVMWNST